MFFSEILNFLYKKSCLICGNKKENSFFCSKCEKEVKYNEFKILKLLKASIFILVVIIPVFLKNL